VNRGSEWRIAILGSLLALCSFGPFYVTPNYLLALQTVHGFSLDQLGYISGAENFLIAIACTVAAFNVRRIGWRMVLAAALVCVAGNVLSMFVTDFASVLAVRALTGLLGEGPLYAMSFAVLGSAANPDRAFGIGFGAVAVGAAIILAAEGAIDRLLGPAGVLVPYAVLALILAAVSAFWREVSGIGIPVDRTGPSVRLRASAMLASIILWSTAAGAFWAFCGTAAGVLGLDETAVSGALAIALTVGLGGILIPIVLGDRLGRVIPLIASTAGLIVACFLFFETSRFLQLAAVLTLFQLCWNIAAVYLPAGIAAIDSTGRYSAFSAVAQIAGMALGPALSGPALVRFGYGFMPFAAAVIVLGALLLFVTGARARAAETVGVITAT
jgi:predicted MFS family arabinose efflux permease